LLKTVIKDSPKHLKDKRQPVTSEANPDKTPKHGDARTKSLAAYNIPDPAKHASHF
jgi:hypothetical protein